MNDSEWKALEDALPEGWRVLRKERQSTAAAYYSETTLQVVSDRYNVVLEGSSDWILRKVTAYTLSYKQGGL